MGSDLARTAGDVLLTVATIWAVTAALVLLAGMWDRWR